MHPSISPPRSVDELRRLLPYCMRNLGIYSFTDSYGRTQFNIEHTGWVSNVDVPSVASMMIERNCIEPGDYLTIIKLVAGQKRTPLKGLNLSETQAVRLIGLARHIVASVPKQGWRAARYRQASWALEDLLAMLKRLPKPLNENRKRVRFLCSLEIPEKSGVVLSLALSPEGYLGTSDCVLRQYIDGTMSWEELREDLKKVENKRP